MGAGVSGNQGKPSILAGAGRGRAFDAVHDAAALRLLEDQKHVFADWTSVKSSLENGTIIRGRDRDILDALVELDAPSKLLEDAGGVFYGMCEAAGTRAQLAAAARKADAKRAANKRD